MFFFKKLFGSKTNAVKENNVSFTPFVFRSNQHKRYEQGNAVMGEQNHVRTVRVEKNTDGCKGYKLEPGRGYIIKIYNDDLGKSNISDKPMDLISLRDEKAVFRGFPIEAMSPFGWQEVDYRDYGLTVYYTNGEVSRCVLHMYDRNVDIEYINTDSVAVKGTSQQTNSIESKVDDVITLAGKPNVNVQLIQTELHALYAFFNKPGGGKLIVNFGKKQKLCECFMFMLKYDWLRDSDIREVWVENGLYCFMGCFKSGNTEKKQAELFLTLFLLLRYGQNSLKHKVQDILNKSQFLCNPNFDSNDYKYGAEYVISQFAFLAINGLRPLAQDDMRIIAEIMNIHNANDFFQECTELNFYSLSPNAIFAKMSFISSIIGSVLEDM